MKKIIISVVLIVSAIQLFAQPLTGTKTIGPSGDYPTFTAASADLLALGVGAGGVEFLVSPGIYNDAVQFFEVPGANAVNRIKFKADGDSVFVVATGTTSTSDAAIRINGGDFYTFEGINIKNGGTSASNFCENGYFFVNLGSFNNGCQGNIVKNCSIDMRFGSVVVNNSQGVRATNVGTVTSVNGAFNNNKFQNLKIDGVERGLSLFGNAGYEGVNNEISNCIIGGGFGVKSQQTANSAIGILVSNLKNTKIFGNEIASVIAASNVTSSVSGISSQLGNSEIFSNTIKKVFHANSGINGIAQGISADAVSMGQSIIYNNFVSGVDNAMTLSNSSIGICGLFSRKFSVGTSQPVHFYNNTVEIKSLITKQVFTSTFMLSNENGGHVAHLKNNIIINTMNGISNFTQHCIIDFNNTAPSGKLISNNNSLVASGTFGRVGRNATSPQLVSTTLANWQANNPGLDVNSVSVTPTFVSPTDFHLVQGSNAGIENGGTPLPQVMGDFDFQVRATDSTDIGADEVLAVTLQESTVSITSDMNPPINCGTTVTFTAVATDAGSAPVFNWFINGILVASNINPFITNQLNPGDEVHCEMISSLLSNSSLPISSNSITVSVNPASLSTFFLDFDEDGFGRNDYTQSLCVQPLGYVALGNDCNDFNSSINPGISEICDGLDNNCINGIDDGLVFIDYFVDNDNDTFGGNDIQILCEPPPPSVTCDGLYTVTIQGTGQMDEISYNIKNAANVTVASGGPFSFGSNNVFNLNLTGGPFTLNFETQGSFNDNTATISLVANGTSLVSTFVPAGQNLSFSNLCGNFQIGPNFVTVGGDCDDNNAAVNPNAVEICDGLDNDCDNSVDEGLVFFDYFEDLDTDGFGGNLVANSCSTITPTVTCNGAYKITISGTGNMNFTTWQIFDASNNLVASAGPFGSGTTNISNLNLTNGPFTFFITTQNAFLVANTANYTIESNGNVILTGTINPNQNLDFANLCGNFQIGPDIVTIGGDCNDNNVAINPSATDVCNGVDDNCDGLDNACVTTKLKNSQCGGTLVGASVAVVALEVPGATAYRFKIEWSGGIIIHDSPVRNFKFSQLTGWSYGQTYQISVAVETGGLFGPFGPICNLFLSEPNAQLTSNFCPAFLSTAEETVTSILIPGASIYRFRIVSAALDTIIVDRPVRWFRFSQHVPGFVYGSTYQVSVSVQTGGVFSSFGSNCNLTLPSLGSLITQLETSSCNVSIASMETGIYASSVAQASSYEFLVENSDLGYSQTLTRPNRGFKLNMLNGILPGTTYSVKVRTIVVGVQNPFGASCNITSPMLPPSANLNGNNNNSTQEEMETEAISGFDAVAFPNPFADAFTLNVRSESTDAVIVRVYDMNGKMLENRNLQASEAATVVIGGNLAAGMYHVTVMQGDNVKTMKMIKTIR